MFHVFRHGLQSLIAWSTLCLFPGGMSGGVVAAADPPPPNRGLATVLGSMHYRPIGPFRGGRSAAVTGVPGKPMLFYFGSTGGGVWRTTDGGSTWENISDGYFGGSIGAVAVSEWDPNVIYVGGGEKTVRGNVSPGSGMWKSTDAGQTWKHVGLSDAQHIPRVRIHPRDPEWVYAAVLGHLYGPHEQRGVFRSRDGGRTWQKILFANDQAGAVDLLLDPNNPRIIYATTWRVKRTPHSLESGGDGSELWKSSDGGDTWIKLTRTKGLPQGTVGIMGVAVSPVDSNRVWVIVEAEDGGLFRSDDGGRSWSRVNDDRGLRQRAWYYSRIYAGPKSLNEVYVLNVGLARSNDGGKSFESIATPHSDHHDLWIDPQDSSRMILGDDGGAQVSFSHGAHWSSYLNQPTAQFYRVTTDNHFPYRIYGAQQDNSTVRILHRSSGFSIEERDWESTAGGESGHLAPDPTDPDIVYGGSYGGYLERLNHRTGESRQVTIWPDNPIGHGAADTRYRFQWNFPLFFSPHQPKTLYAAANVLFKSETEGQSWEQISPDLTRNDKSRQGASGGPITKDNTGVEYYCTIFAALESPHESGVLWAGSDDGLVHLSRDRGKSWKNVSPPYLPEWALINSLEPHPTEKGGLYLAATRYKLDDFQPYLYKTTDYGQTWIKIVDGIPSNSFTRVVRADRKRAGLLYCGTENGLFVSLDDGATWQPFQQNLPTVPITDLAVRDAELIVATQGRSFWLLDDLIPLQQWKPEWSDEAAHLFPPRPAYRLRGGGTLKPPRTAGQNPAAGVSLSFLIKEDLAADTAVTLDILTAEGALVRQFSRTAKEENDKLTVQTGMNRFVWNLRYPDAEKFDGLIMWAGSTTGPLVRPGNYQARLTVGKLEQTVPVVVLPDPRISTTADDFTAQFQFLLSVRDKLSETHVAIKKLRAIRDQLRLLTGRLDEGDATKSVRDAAKSIENKLDEIENALYQTKNRSPQDPLNYPIRLNNRLSAVGGVVSDGDNRPTEQSIKVRDEVVTAIDAELAKLAKVLGEDVPRFNELVRDQRIPAIFVEPGKR